MIPIQTLAASNVGTQLWSVAHQEPKYIRKSGKVASVHHQHFLLLFCTQPLKKLQISYDWSSSNIQKPPQSFFFLSAM